MNRTTGMIIRSAIMGVMCLLLFGVQIVWAANIDATYKYAWSENAGWQNWRSTNAQATVMQTYLTGYVWAENIGWIKLGADAGGPYANTTSTNWGVNRNSSTGALSGYAWSENAGWINFAPTHGGVTIDLATGDFCGYAWSENMGWINLAGTAQNSTPYKVKTDPTSYTVTGSAGAGGGIDPASRTVTHGNTTTFTVTPNTGYSIASVTGCGGSLSGNTYTTGDITGACTVSATFSSNTYTVTFNANGGTPPSPSSKQVIYDSTYGPLATTTRDGYTLKGWFTAATGGTQITSGNSVTTASDHTLYAQWTINTYTFTVGANPVVGGTVVKNPDKANYTHGETVQLTATASAGYAFTGWSGDLSGTTNPATITVDGNKNITANFGLTYAVTYNGNGNTGGAAPVDGNAYVQGATVTVLGPGTLEKAGSAFTSWNTAANGSGASYAPGTQFTMPAANMTLYAQWGEPIPTLSEWGMILMVVLLCGISAYAIRRQRREA